MLSKIIDGFDFSKFTDWLCATGNFYDIVISSRIRLGRNLKDTIFPHIASHDILETVAERVKEAAKKIPMLSDGHFINLSTLDSIYKQALFERHLISHEHRKARCAVVIISRNQEISIMVNEEDHLRIQGFHSGLNFSKIYQTLSELENELQKYLEFAFSARLGYLTACPTNLGTALRASVLLHLPALCMSGEIRRLIKEVTKLGITIRGLYGEGTEAVGSLFQISNEVTLGQTEEDLMENVKSIVTQVIDYERKAKERLYKERKSSIEDEVWRAYGSLKYARMMSSKEALELLSLARLGVNLNIINIPYQTLNELLVITQPAHIQILSGSYLSAPMRDYRRAEIIRDKAL